MKTNLTTIFSLLILVLLNYSCTKQSADQVKQPGVSGMLTSRSECLNQLKSSTNLQADSNQSCIIYNYDAEEKRLDIIHENAGFNCCPGAINCSISLSGDTITVEEIPEYAICNCECLFNLDMEMNGLTGKTYFLKFVEPLVGEQQKLEFTISLDQDISGEYCVERNQYPWGI